VKDTIRPVDMSPGPGYALGALAEYIGVNADCEVLPIRYKSGGWPMRTAHQVARAFAELTPRERKKAIELIPELLRRDEPFILRRRRQGHRDLLAGRTVSALEAIVRALARRRNK